jgi:hypothetical protein
MWARVTVFGLILLNQVIDLVAKQARRITGEPACVIQDQKFARTPKV